MCDDFNNSHLCEFNLLDCCGPNTHLDGSLDACFLCACIPVMYVLLVLNKANCKVSSN